MKTCGLVCSILAVSGMLFGSAWAADPVETAAEGCKREIEGFCNDVTPGEGRILACLYAYNDKLSGQCDYALFNAALQLEQAVAALTHVANECSDEIEKNCAAVQAGEGRVLA